MAKYNRLDAPLRTAKEFNNISFNRELGDERTLKTMNKVRENNRLYNEGKKLALAGGDINTAIELVEENGKMISKKDHRNFKAGYMEGLRLVKEQIGYVSENENNKTR